LPLDREPWAFRFRARAKFFARRRVALSADERRDQGPYLYRPLEVHVVPALDRVDGGVFERTQPRAQLLVAELVARGAVDQLGAGADSAEDREDLLVAVGVRGVAAHPRVEGELDAAVDR